MKLIRWYWCECAYESWCLLGLQTFCIGILGWAFIAILTGTGG